ncbi:MAG: rhomboid family intramembrane serine protease [Deltaproteobacteria bacterium]|nr:rhomboid family intramembrane serine protease [Deltaproteobacteria bacterium]
MPSYRFQLQKPGLSSAVQRGVPILVLVFVLAVVLRPAVAASIAPATFALVGLIAALGSMAYVLIRHAKQPAPWLEVFPDRLVVAAGGEGEVALHFRDLVDLAVVQHGREAYLHIGTRDGRVVIPVAAFATQEDVERLMTEVRARVTAFVADGAERLELFERRAKALSFIPQGRTPVTQVLLLLLVVGYGLEDLSGAFTDMTGLTLLALGANSPILVRSGEVFRLVTANFLHGFPLHLFLNAVAIWNLGSVIERSIRSHRLLFVYVMSAIGGSVVSVAWNASSISLGASTAAFGLLGSFLLLHIRKMVPAAFRQTRFWWVVTLGVNAALPIGIIQANAQFGMSLPYIDMAAHVGGLLSGVLATWVVLPTRISLPPTKHAPWYVRALAGLTVIVLVTGVGLGAVNYFNPRYTGLQRATQMLERSDLLDAMGKNQFAWLVAIDPSSSRRDLELALAAAKAAWAAMSEPNARDGIEDTVATLEYRLGAFDEAIAREAGILSRSPNNVYASQLARFLAARLEAAGPIEGPDVGAGLALTTVADKDGVRMLEGMISSGPSTDGVVYALAKQGETLIGLLRLPLEAGVSGALSTEKLGNAPFPEGTTFVPALFVSGKLDKRHWPMDKEVSTYAVSSPGAR